MFRAPRAITGELVASQPRLNVPRSWRLALRCLLLGLVGAWAAVTSPACGEDPLPAFANPPGALDAGADAAPDAAGDEDAGPQAAR